MHLISDKIPSNDVIPSTPPVVPSAARDLHQAALAKLCHLPGDPWTTDISVRHNVNVTRI